MYLCSILPAQPGCEHNDSASTARSRCRIVPDCYRKHFPTSMKSHRSHDIVLLCVPCHMAALAAAERTKQALATEQDVPLHLPAQPLLRPENDESGDGDGGDGGGCGEAGVRPPTALNARKAALVLEHNGTALPPARRRQLEGTVFTCAPRSAPLHMLHMLQLVALGMRLSR